MKKMTIVLANLIFMFFVMGCTQPVDGVHDDTEQSFTVINSGDSTFRIVDGQANKIGENLRPLNIDGDGIHKGGSQSFSVSSDDCDNDWKIVVYYNDQDRTNCEATKFITCGRSTSFIFNNTTCSSGLD